ncbi:hypothetical protein SFIMM107S_05882 [Streptomyces griseus]
MQLLGLGETAVAGGVERGGLVRVLAVAQDVLAGEGVAEELREARVVGGRVVVGEPGGDGHVVGGGVLEGLGGEPLAGGEVEAAGLGGGEDVGVPLGAGDDGHGRVVLGGGADHRGAADVDLLDALVVGGARGDGLLERVEVHHDQVEGLDAQLGELLAVGVQAEVGEDAGVDAGVQRLDAAVQALGEAGELLDLGDRHSGGGDLPGGGAGGDELDARLVQTAGEVFEPRLVVDTDQGAADGLIHRHDRDEPFVPQCDSRHGRSAPRPRRAACARLP